MSEKESHTSNLWIFTYWYSRQYHGYCFKSFISLMASDIPKLSYALIHLLEKTNHLSMLYNLFLVLLIVFKGRYFVNILKDFAKYFQNENGNSSFTRFWARIFDFAVRWTHSIRKSKWKVEEDSDRKQLKLGKITPFIIFIFHMRISIERSS